MALSAQSRLKVLDNPVLAPGVCFLNGCVGDGNRKFIDFGRNIEWYGAVYICTQCIVEVVEAADYIPVAAYDVLHGEHRKLKVELDQLKAKYAPFEEAIKNVVDSPPSGFGMVLHPSNSVLSGDEVSSVDETNDGKSIVTEPETDESSDVEGPDDLFDATDFDDD
jgi:hypothetical protein